MTKPALRTQLAAELAMWQHLLLAIRCGAKGAHTGLAIVQALAYCKDIRNMIKELSNV